MSPATPHSKRPSRSLPEKPSLDQLRKQAKDRQTEGAHRTLSASQLAVAREYGFASWPKLKTHVELLMLRRLISENAVAPLRVLLQSSPTLAKAAFDDGSTPLHVAAEENRPEVVTLLSEFGATLERRYPGSAHTALSWAVTCWSFDAATRLVELGNEPDLFCAAGLGLMEKVQAFWKNGRLTRHPSQTGSSRYDGAGNRLLRAFVTEALQEKLSSGNVRGGVETPRWMKGFGQLRPLRRETARIQRVIDQEFGFVEPEDRR